MENDSTRNLRVNPDANSDDVTAHVQAPEKDDFRAAFVTEPIVKDEDVEGHLGATRVPLTEEEDVEGHRAATRVPLAEDEDEDVEGHLGATRVPLTGDQDVDGLGAAFRAK